MAERQPGSARESDDSPERDARESMWLQQVAQGGPQGMQALKQLYLAYSRRMVSFFTYNGMSEEEANDQLHDVWVRIAERAGSFDPSRRASTWIWAVARHLLIDEARGPWRSRVDKLGEDLESTLGALGHGTVPNQALAGEAIDDCVRRGLLRFAAVDRQGAWAVRLRDIQGWNVGDLADYLDRSEGATRTYLSQLRRKLRPFLEPCFELLST